LGSGSGDAVTPLTVLHDEKFSYRYQGQVWTPRNYDNKFRGKVPAYYALKESLNVPTAQLGLKVGLQNIVEVAHRAGIDSQLEALPSLTLGAFELKPVELTKAYLAIMRMGSKIDPQLLLKVQTQKGEVLLDRTGESSERVFAPDVAAVLVGMMKNTLRTGTAKAAEILGFHGVGAGKTGTTSDTKDAWFIGSTPKVLTLVWVGYDNNALSGLTGASGALPLWVRFMTQAFPDASDAPVDFAWPEGVKPHRVEAAELAPLFDGLPESEVGGVELVF
jgi:penicillin-binding protein 1B